MSDDDLSLADLIQRAQDSERGLSYQGIARVSGLSKAKIGQLADRNSKYNVRPETVEKLARGLHLPLHVVQRAAMVTAGIAPVGDGRSARVELIASKLDRLPDDLLDIIEAMIDAAAKKGRG
ncbi:hypothetical protein [Nocardioides sp.]|uniref:hypothetical protein n=1 Tax=Nocardioides sp. TaxID=35761 RepID=UPI0039E6CB31